VVTAPNRSNQNQDAVEDQDRRQPTVKEDRSGGHAQTHGDVGARKGRAEMGAGLVEHGHELGKRSVTEGLGQLANLGVEAAAGDGQNCVGERRGVEDGHGRENVFPVILRF